MRKIESFVIGALVCGSCMPTTSSHAILPWRATSTIAPGITPLATSAFSRASSRARRSDESPTCSGLTVGSVCAAAGATVRATRESRARSITVRRVIGESSVAVILPLKQPARGQPSGDDAGQPLDQRVLVGLHVLAGNPRELLRRARGVVEREHVRARDQRIRSEEHTFELQSHSFISYAVFC